MSELTTKYDEILAVLRDVERRAGNFTERGVMRGLLIGPPVCLVVCLLLGNLLVLAGPHRDEAFTDDINRLVGIYGFLLGLCLGPIVDAIRKQKKATELALEKVMTGFSADEVGKVLRDHELQLPNSAGAFARIQKRKFR
jgi:hypothetical protein